MTLIDTSKTKDAVDAFRKRYGSRLRLVWLLNALHVRSAADPDHPFSVIAPDRRLPAPYGYPSGTSISIRWNPIQRKGLGVSYGGAQVPRWPSRRQADMIGGLTVGWGCPAFIALKVADAVYASGRYDCRVTVSERSLENLTRAMSQLGCNVVYVTGKMKAWKDEEIK